MKVDGIEIPSLATIRRALFEEYVKSEYSEDTALERAKYFLNKGESSHDWLNVLNGRVESVHKQHQEDNAYKLLQEQIDDQITDFSNNYKHINNV